MPGPGMHRDDDISRLVYGSDISPWGLSFDQIVGDSDNEDIVSEDGDEVPPGPRDPPGEPYATWEETMANAPDDYANLKSYFLWEKRNNQRAPAILNRDALAYVPWLPVIGDGGDGSDGDGAANGDGDGDGTANALTKPVPPPAPATSVSTQTSPPAIRIMSAPFTFLAETSSFQPCPSQVASRHGQGRQGCARTRA
ncbi:hypothetical protein SEUCBS140593_006228 [Sporothrix eucalyptigena]|uniref:Uncharacterized protein n=1 Tax=Sporothrix eucalyptigena TaxID=1812306 RepID=A0ABP0C338_9PEZI